MDANACLSRSAAGGIGGRAKRRQGGNMRQHLRSITTTPPLAALLVALVVICLGHPVGAQRGWDHLRTKEIGGRVNHDKLRAHGHDPYTALQFRVKGAAVQFDRVVVEYGNHQTRAYPFRMLVRSNGVSRVLDLAGGERDITSVEFWYEKASWGHKPEVRLYGRR